MTADYTTNSVVAEPRSSDVIDDKTMDQHDMLSGLLLEVSA
jgi:hypothetical protein